MNIGKKDGPHGISVWVYNVKSLVNPVTTELLPFLQAYYMDHTVQTGIRLKGRVTLSLDAHRYPLNHTL